MQQAAGVLVTGGLGFIGSHTCVALIEAGYEVIAVDNLSNSDVRVRSAIEEISAQAISFYQLDICSTEALRAVFQAHRITAVIHFAGLKAVGESCERPLSYYQHNVAGSINLLQLMRQFNVEHFIFSSSATVYGEPEYLPLDEAAATRPMNPYGQTKRMVERILEDACTADANFNAIALRYFNPVGAHPSALIGEDPQGQPNNLVPFIVKVAAGELAHLSIFGDDYPTPDGTGVRDYIHVLDLASGHVKALDALFGGRIEHFDIINLGTGAGHSVREVVNLFEQVNAVNVPVSSAPRRSGDIASCYANADYAAAILNWRAERTLEAMLIDTWRYKQACLSAHQH